MVPIDYFKDMQGAVKYSAGDVIFKVGDPDDSLYAMKSGEVELSFGGHLLEKLGPGDIMGEKSLIDDKPHTTTAVAKTDCEIFKMDEAKFLFLVHETPMFALHIMRIMAERTRKIMMLAV